MGKFKEKLAIYATAVGFTGAVISSQNFEKNNLEKLVRIKEYYKIEKELNNPVRTKELSHLDSINSLRQIYANRNYLTESKNFKPMKNLYDQKIKYKRNWTLSYSLFSTMFAFGSASAFSLYKKRKNNNNS